jgi:hypothetical protein
MDGSNKRPLPDWPRGLTEELAAAYIGLSKVSLRNLEKGGEFSAVWLTIGRKVYLRDHLDAFLDRKAGVTFKNSWDED